MNTNNQTHLIYISLYGDNWVCTYLDAYRFANMLLLTFQGAFDVVRKVFSSGEETAHMTVNDKSDLFFHDYSFGPLFVQENYISVQPSQARLVIMGLIR